MVQGVRDAAELVTQALAYLAYENKIFGVWACLVIVCLLLIYFVGKLTNTD